MTTCPCKLEHASYATNHTWPLLSFNPSMNPPPYQILREDTYATIWANSSIASFTWLVFHGYSTTTVSKEDAIQTAMAQPYPPTNSWCQIPRPRRRKVISWLWRSRQQVQFYFTWQAMIVSTMQLCASKITRRAMRNIATYFMDVALATLVSSRMTNDQYIWY